MVLSWTVARTTYAYLPEEAFIAFKAAVHILNFTSSGNGSFIKWSVYPAHSANYISNTTAMDIVLRVTDHHLRFPENFGSYQLLDWSIQSEKQTWWRAHSLIVIVVAIVSLVLSLLIIGTWFIWRHKREAIGGSYEPVGAAVSEQELQPFDHRESEVWGKTQAKLYGPITGEDYEDNQL